MPLTTESALRKDITQQSGHAVMQHRHFAEIAATIRDMGGNCEMHMSREDVAAVANHFANRLARTNPRFDRARFLRACGV